MDKILWSQIHQLDQKDGCFASNKYLAEIMKRSVPWISQRIAKLKKIGYLFEESFDGRKRILRCIIPSELNTSLIKFIRQPYKIYKADSNVPIIVKKKELKEIYPPVNQKWINLSSKQIRETKKLYPDLMKNIPSSSKNNGAIELEKLERIDKFKYQEIKSSILWAVQDSFWGTKILSCASIRNKSKNGNTKFKNMFIAYLESIPKKKKIPSQDYKKRGGKTYNKVDMKPQM